MKTNTIALCILTAGLTNAAPLDRAQITEIVNDVRVIERTTRTAHAAQMREEFRAPNVLRTGINSRAELIAADQTVTRVGSNTLFSFQPESRTMALEKGSLLFHSPAGRGGGTIRTSAASAAVLGTTLIVSATKAGAMKVVMLEGKGSVTLPGGKSVILAPGQLVIVMPGAQLSPVLDFQLSRQVSASMLVRGFRAPLASAPRVEQAVRVQERKIQEGRLAPNTGGKLPPPPRDRQASGEAPPPPPPPPPPPSPRVERIGVQGIDVKRLPVPQKPPPPPPPPKQGGNQKPR